MKITDRRHSALVDPNGNALVRSGAPNQGRRGVAYGSLTHGGLMNATTGLGTSLDKSESSFFTPTRLYWRSPLEVLYVQSWACGNAINIPIEDMFSKWRRLSDGDMAGAAEAFEEEEERLKIKVRLPLAMVGGCITGTGMLVMQTREAPMEEPLDVDRIRPGDLTAVNYFDRYDASVWSYDREITSDTYGEPEHYNFHPSMGGYQRVHRSRVLRFDGITPWTMSRFDVYEQDWGVSEIIPIIISLMQDQVLASGISHLSQEASISVLKVENLRETIAGRGESDDTTAEMIGQQVNELKSIYRLLMLDKGMEDFERVAVQFAGLADLMDRFSGRVAAARQIPKTRFLSSSPAGMNSTGESDLTNYYERCESMRAKKLEAAGMDTLDMVIARSAGLDEPPEYEWPSMMEQTDLEKATADLELVKAWKEALAMSLVDEDEGRAKLDGTWSFGELPGPAPEPPEPDPSLMPPMPPIGGPKPGPPAPPKPPKA